MMLVKKLLVSLPGENTFLVFDPNQNITYKNSLFAHTQKERKRKHIISMKSTATF